jgi:hypothetical protein
MGKIPPVFLRRYNSHKIEKIMKRGAIHAYFDSKNKEEFKKQLAGDAIDVFLYSVHNIDPEETMTKEDFDNTIDYIINIFNPLMDIYYRNLKRDYPEHHKL